jgi:site-specific recombinase XerC
VDKKGFSIPGENNSMSNILAQQIDSFLASLKLKGYSPCTVESYALDLKQLVSYFEELGEPGMTVEALTRQKMRS